METGKFRVKYKAEKPCDYTIDVRINGQNVKNSPQTVKALDSREGFKLMSTACGEKSGIKYFSEPISVGVGKNGQIAIVDGDNHQVVMFTVDGEFLKCIDERGTGNGQLMDPYGVLFNEDRLLVTDNHENTGRLQEFDLNGDYYRTIYKGRGVQLLGMCTTDETIAVCFGFYKYEEMFSGGVEIFNKQSGQLLTGMFCVYEDMVPCCIAYADNKYFLSYPLEYCVRVSDHNGVFLCKFGEKGKGGGHFNWPHGLAVINNSILLICETGNNRVQMLTLDGQFTRSFGHKGSGLGEMMKPWDIDVTQYGQVFVCDRWNDRVQVWK